MAPFPRCVSSLLLCVIVQQFYGVCGGGRLYFGFTEYNNDGNRKNDGNCCDGEEDDSGQCPVACDLIFQLSISGLDAANTTNRRPSDIPFNSSGQSHLPFQSAGQQDIINPLDFTFNHWPGCLHVVVEIFDVDPESPGQDQKLELVDTMTLEMALASPFYFFTKRELTGQRPFQPSHLTVVIRYDCNTTSSASQCSPVTSDNVTSLYENIMDCPTSPPPSSTSTTTTSTTPTPTTPTTTTTQPSTTLTTSHNAETSEETLHTSHNQKPTSVEPSTPTTTTTTATTLSSSASTFSPSTRTTSATTSPTNGLPPVTTKDTNSGPMDYWAAILGAVLGTLVIVAVVGFLIYYRRRKAMYKRREIYTVTPRIVSVVEENGTAGRSDIPVETTEF